MLAEGYVGDVLAVEIQANQGQFVDAEAPLHWRQDAALSGLNVMTMGIWYEALMRWLGPARRVMALTKIAVPRRKDAGGAWQDVRVPDHVEILATLGRGAVGAHALQHGDGAGAAERGVDLRDRGHAQGRVRCQATSPADGAATRRLREIPIPAERRIGWRVEEEFVNAIRGREKVTRTTFEDGVRYMEFTEAVWKSAAERSGGRRRRACDERLALLRQHADHHDHDGADQQRQPGEEERGRQRAHRRVPQRAAVIGRRRRRGDEASRAPRERTHRGDHPPVFAAA